MRADEALAALAARQHGVVSRQQLIKLGLSRDQIARRVSNGQLQPMHRGVYLASPVPPPLAREAAAVLACGAGSAISHRTSARLAGIWDGDEGEIDITVPHHRRVEPGGIRVHRTRTLRQRDIRRHQGLPVTAPLRTLIDLADVLGPRELEQAVARAQAKRIVPHRLTPTQPLPPSLRAVFEGTPALTRSEAEERLLRLIRRAGLPEPRVNTRLNGYEVDFVWPDSLLVVEVDGFAFHADRAAFERDRRRDQDLGAAGYRVARVTWRQIEQEPEALLVRLTRLLGGVL